MMAIFITVLGMLFSGVVALIIGYLHRKQLRQIEAFRQNPAVGLIPPPHAIVVFHRKHWILISIGTASIIGLILVKTKISQPLSYASVLTIAFCAAGLYVAPLFDILARLIEVVRMSISIELDLLKRMDALLREGTIKKE